MVSSPLRSITLGMLFLAAFLVPSFAQAAYPSHLPRYKVDVHLDVAKGEARVYQIATWTNPTTTPTDRLVFHVHSRYVCPEHEIGFMAKMLEIVRVQPSEGIHKEAPCEIHKVSLSTHSQLTPLKYHFEGDTKTTMVVALPFSVGAGESVTVALDFTMHLPNKQGRWGQWQGVTTLASWLPVFAYYGEAHFGAKRLPPSPG